VARKKQHYVDNERFLEVMSDYREKYLQAKDNDTELPVIPDYAGECFLKIAERLSHRPNFINYAFREEMVSDGIENCVMYASNFNPEKSNNPFAYFTQIIYYAFLRRIAKEKKQTHVRNKMIENNQYESWTTIDGDTSSYSVIGFDPTVMLPEEDVYKPKKKPTAKRKGLETFMEEET